MLSSIPRYLLGGATAQADASNPCVHDVIVIARCRTHTKDLTLINALDLNRHNMLTPKSLFKGGFI